MLRLYISTTMFYVNLMALDYLLTRNRVFKNGWKYCFSIDDFSVLMSCFVPGLRFLTCTGLVLLNGIKARNKKGKITLYHDANIYLGEDEHLYANGKKF